MNEGNVGFLNVVPMQLENGKWTLGEESAFDHQMYPILFAEEYDTKDEAWQAIEDEEYPEE